MTILHISFLSSLPSGQQFGFGQFEQAHVAPSVEGDLEVNLRPDGIRGVWQPPVGSAHGRAVRDELAQGRALPQLPTQPLDAIARWATLRPLLADWTPDADDPRVKHREPPKPPTVAGIGVFDVLL